MYILPPNSGNILHLLRIISFCFPFICRRIEAFEAQIFLTKTADSHSKVNALMSHPFSMQHVKQT